VLLICLPRSRGRTAGADGWVSLEVSPILAHHPRVKSSRQRHSTKRLTWATSLSRSPEPEKERPFRNESSITSCSFEQTTMTAAEYDEHYQTMFRKFLALARRRAIALLHNGRSHSR
jgi:hypothetical protein